MDGKSITVYLFQLERQDSPGPDEATKIIVAAPSEKAARESANSEGGSEGYIWTDGTLVLAKKIGIAEDGVSGVICVSKE